ncbi:MAG: ABC transporter ATP-binding protein [Thermomicrobiales bacterium]
MASDSGRYVFETDSFHKAYGPIVALEALTVRVPEAAIGLLGANGAGKSTLIKGLLGLLEPTSGSAAVLGMPVASQGPEIRQRIGYMPESDTLPGDVTAADFVGHMAEMSGLPTRAARQRANDVLYQVGLNEERYRLMREFSTGMKQRAKLAQAIVHDPDLVFLDEPTNGMDPQGRDEMLALIRKIHNELGITVMLSSHILGDVERVCDYVIMLDSGSLVVADDIANLRSTTADVVIRIDGARNGFMAALRARGIEATESGSEIVISASSDSEFDAVRDAVVESGVSLRALQPRELTLEDVYIRTVSGIERHTRTEDRAVAGGS